MHSESWHNALSEETTPADNDLKRRTGWIDRRREIEAEQKAERKRAESKLNPWEIFVNMTEKGAYFFDLTADLVKGTVEGSFEYPDLRNGGRGLDWKLPLSDILEGARQQNWIELTDQYRDEVKAIEDKGDGYDVSEWVPTSLWLADFVSQENREPAQRVIAAAMREYFTRELDKAQKEVANLKDLPEGDSYRGMIAYRALRFLQDYIRHTRPSCVA